MTTKDERTIAKLQREIDKRDSLLRECIGAEGGRSYKVSGLNIAGLGMLSAISSQRENADKTRLQARKATITIQNRVRKLLGIKLWDQSC